MRYDFDYILLGSYAWVISGVALQALWIRIARYPTHTLITRPPLMPITAD